MRLLRNGIHLGPLREIYTSLMAHASQKSVELLKAKLQALDSIPVHIDGKIYIASQCYRYGLDPLHILYNTNCPRYLKEQIEYIFSKYAR